MKKCLISVLFFTALIILFFFFNCEETVEPVSIEERIAKFLLDLNEDGEVDEDEIRAVIEFLQQPERRSTPGRWWSLLDFDRDGSVSGEELLEGWEMYLRPHPVNPEFRLDVRLDTNGNGFVEPQEIGIAAGFSQGRPIPSFDERLERLGWREERAADSGGTATETRFVCATLWQRPKSRVDCRVAPQGRFSQ